MKKDEQERPWFESWFATDLYDKMYQHRNDAEAEFFLDNLLKHIQPPKQALFLDLACGTGRHSRYIHRQGYDVVGVDLSARSIALANEHATDGLSFFVQDMREVFRPNHFDIILNLFTSFGYFDDVADNVRVIESVKESLKPKGLFLLDFFNATVVAENLVERETKSIDEWHVDIHRYVEQKRLIKSMHWTFGEKTFKHEEKVSLFSMQDLLDMLTTAGLDVIDTFGDYALNAFDSATSPRAMVLCQR